MRFAQRLSNLMRRAGAAIFTPAEDPRKLFASGYTRQRQLLAEIQGSLAEVTELAFAGGCNIHTDIAGESLSLPRDAVIPLALILHELLVNAYQHAFPFHLVS